MPSAGNAEVAAYIGRWKPRSVTAEAAEFARDVISRVAPGGQERAKNLLRAAGRLAGYGIGPGLEPVPEVLLHPSVAGRFTRCAPGLSGVARLTALVKTRLRRMQYRPGLLDGFLAKTGLDLSDFHHLKIVSPRLVRRLANVGSRRLFPALGPLALPGQQRPAIA